jgi:ABC-2 type transport system permease protein
MTGVYGRLADLNPISHLIEGFRDLVIDGLTLSAVARTLLISGVMAVGTMALALRSLHKRLAAR